MKREGYSTVMNWNYVGLFFIPAIALSMAIIYSPETRTFDANLLETIRAFLTQFPMSIPTTITAFWDASHYAWPQVTVCAVLLSHKKFFKTFLFIFLCEAVKLTLIFLKDFVCRERPSAYEGFSFPSGHALFSTYICGVVIYLVNHYVANKFWKYLLITIFLLIIVAISISRLWLNVHYPLDVLAGACIGIVFVNLYIIACKIMNWE